MDLRERAFLTLHADIMEEIFAAYDKCVANSTYSKRYGSSTNWAGGNDVAEKLLKPFEEQLQSIVKDRSENWYWAWDYWYFKNGGSRKVARKEKELIGRV